MRPYTTQYIRLTDEEWSRVYATIFVKAMRGHSYVGFFGVLLAVVGFLLVQLERPGQILVVAGLCFLGTGIIYRISYMRSIRKHNSAPENAALLSEARAHVDESGIGIQNKSGMSSHYPWSLFFKVEDLGDMRLLYVGKAAPIVMVKRSHTTEDWDSFSAWIDAKIPKAATP